MTWFDELVMALVNALTSLVRLVGRYFSGRQLADPPTSDATFLRRGTRTSRRGGFAAWWSVRAGWERLLLRLVPVVAALGWLVSPWVSVAVVLAACVAAAVLWTRLRRNRAAYATGTADVGFDPLPLFHALAPVLRLDTGQRWHDWVGIPPDIASAYRSQPVYVKLPPNRPLAHYEREQLVWVANQHLPGDWAPLWHPSGFVELHPVPEALPHRASTYHSPTAGAPAPPAFPMPAPTYPQAPPPQVPPPLSVPPQLPTPLSPPVPPPLGAALPPMSPVAGMPPLPGMPPEPPDTAWPAGPPSSSAPSAGGPPAPDTLGGGPSQSQAPAVPVVPPAVPPSIEEAFAAPPMVIIDGEQAERERYGNG